MREFSGAGCAVYERERGIYIEIYERERERAQKGKTDRAIAGEGDEEIG